jgi:hypothetical protein
MFILLTTLFLFSAALALVILRVMRPDYRYSWLIAAGGAFLAWTSVLLWQVFMPLTLILPSWQPAEVFNVSPQFYADTLAWPFALGLATLALAILLTAVVRQDFPHPYSWAGTLTLTGLGILAVLADNPLTLVLVWAALDLTELVTQIVTVEGEKANERLAAAFAARAAGIGLLLWAANVSLSSGAPLDFHATQPEVGMLLILAAGLRLGILPLHLSYTSDSTYRRGFGTALRIVSAVSSLTLLAHIPPESARSVFAPFLLLLITVAALYGGLMWMRASDELTGRPYWVIGMASLAMASALRGNPVGAVAWGAALALAGGVLFISTMQHKNLTRALVLLGAWGCSSLPFSPTASVWQTELPLHWTGWLTFPFLLAAQALLVTGFIRHTLRPAAPVPLEAQPIWAKNVYPFGIGAMLLTLTTLGLLGWDGARLLGSLPAGLTAGALTAGLFWLTPRLRWLNPVRAHWAQPEEPSSPIDSAYAYLWNLYTQAGRALTAVAAMLEGEGGILWALLFLVLFLSILAPRMP